MRDNLVAFSHLLPFPLWRRNKSPVLMTSLITKQQILVTKSSNFSCMQPLLATTYVKVPRSFFTLYTLLYTAIKILYVSGRWTKHSILPQILHFDYNTGITTAEQCVFLMDELSRCSIAFWHLRSSNKGDFMCAARSQNIPSPND